MWLWQKSFPAIGDVVFISDWIKVKFTCLGFLMIYLINTLQLGLIGIPLTYQIEMLLLNWIRPKIHGDENYLIYTAQVYDFGVSVQNIYNCHGGR